MINKELIEKFKDMADCADAAYANLDKICESSIINKYFQTTSIGKISIKEYGDNITLGDKVKDDIKDNKDNILHKKNDNTTYARAIEARFCEDFFIDSKDIANTNININNANNKSDKKDNQTSKIENKRIKINNNPNNIPSKDTESYTLSLRTKNFVNRFELVHHIPNTTISGFSATLFYDTENKEYILSFRGTEMIDPRDIITDFFVATHPPIAIDQALALSMLAKRILRVVIAHQERLASENADTYLYIHDLDSQKQAYKSFQSLANYFMQNNIKFIITGHSLGGHLAQLFCVGYPLLAKEIYTYNAPGIGGIITTAMILFLRVLRIIWKLLVVLVKSVAKLFNPNGFTRKVLDKSLQASGYEGESENLIRVMEANKGHTIFGELGLNAKKVKRGENLGVEIHHIESIRAAMRNDESTQATWQQLWEPTSSIVSDLGIKLGLNIDDKLDYKNTEALHLINVAKHSHFMIDTAQTLYFYTYLLSYKANAEKYQDYTIAQMLDSLNEFAECLQRLLEPTAKELNKKAKHIDKDFTANAITILLDNLWYVYLKCNKEIAIDEDINFYIDDQTLIDTCYKLNDKGYKIKILDKKDIEQIDIATCSIAEKRALCQLEPFIFINENNSECLNANNYTQIYRYNSNSTKIIYAKDNDIYWNIRKSDMMGVHFDKNVFMAPLA